MLQLDIPTHHAQSVQMGFMQLLQTHLPLTCNPAKPTNMRSLSIAS